MKRIIPVIWLLAVIAIPACKKSNSSGDGTLATVKTLPLSVTSTTALSGGDITSDGGATVTARGVCWSTVINPTISGSHSSDGSGIGTFSSTITGLTPNTTYYVRAYATNSNGTAYGNQVTTTTVVPDVYVAGYKNDFSFPVAAIWKNETLTMLSSGPSNANSVFVSGSDVYVAGYDRSTWNVATIWKNGVAIPLSTTPGDADAAAVYVSGTDVYAAGYENSGGKKVAKFWKNGVATPLTNGSFDAYAESIYIEGTNVYVVGHETNGSYYVAKIWKNGVATVLSNGLSDAFAMSVFVSGADVYVAGYVRNAGKHIATLWKNAIPGSLTPNTSDGYANSVFVSGNDVYVAGYEDTGLGTDAKLWKNGVASNLSHGANPGYPAYATGVFVTGTDVYVSGYALCLCGGTNYTARIWKNAVPGYLSLSYNAKEIKANAVFVK